MSAIKPVYAVVETGGLRADRYISENLGLRSRSQLKLRLLELTVNEKSSKLSTILEAGDRLVVVLQSPLVNNLEPQAMDLNILYEDDQVIVINKPSGLVVHPAAGHHDETLVNGLLHYVHDLGDEDFSDEMRPGIVHRLDKETSGVMIIAKNPEAQAFLSTQFQERKTKKIYLALTSGKIPAQIFSVKGFIRRDPIDRKRFAWHESIGKPAHTDFQVLASSGPIHLILATLHTGRTHQIRVHLKHMGLPIVGDTVYGKSLKNVQVARCMLHARLLGITLPGLKGWQEFKAEFPADFIACCRDNGLGDCSLISVNNGV